MGTVKLAFLEQYTSFEQLARADGETTKSFPALEWLAAMCSHIPNRGEQMVRY